MKRTGGNSGGDGGGMSNGGILGSGIFGLFGTMVNCDAESDSIYCNIIKIFNILMIVGIVLVIIYLIYSYMSTPKQMGGRKSRGRR